MNAHCRACGAAVPSPTPAQCPTCRRSTSQGDPRVFGALVDALVAGGVATRKPDGIVRLGNGIVLTHAEDDPEDARRVRRLEHTRRSFPAMRLSRAEDGKGHPVFRGEINVGTTFTDQTVATLFAHAQQREHVRQLLRGLDDALVLGPGGIALSTAEHEVGALDPHAVFADAGRIDALDQSLAEITPEISPFIRASRALSAGSLVVFIMGIVGFEMHHARFQPTSELVYLVMAPVPILMFALLAIVARTTRQRAISPGPIGCLSLPLGFIGAPLLAYVVVVSANALLDPTVPVPIDVVVSSARLEEGESTDELDYVATLHDPADATSTISIRIDEPPCPETTRTTLRLAICPGALGIRWYCQMP